MYRTYELTEEEKNKITRMHWDGDTHYYDSVDGIEYCVQHDIVTNDCVLYELKEVD